MRTNAVLAVAGLTLLSAAAAQAKKDTAKFFPLNHVVSVVDDRGAQAGRVPDLREFSARASDAGLVVHMRLHEDVPAWEHLVKVEVAPKDGKETDRIVQVASETEWVVRGKADPPADPKAKPAETGPKHPFPKEIARGALTRRASTYTMTIPWAHLPEGTLWVWASAADWDADAKAIADAEAEKATSDGSPPEKKKDDKESTKLPAPLNLSDRAPDGGRVLEVPRPGAAPAAGNP